MRLFDLIEQDDLVRASAHGLSQLATFLITHIAGRRPHQTRDGMPFAVFGHVHLQQGILIVKQEPREGFRQFGLAHPAGAEKDERTHRAARILQPRARPPDGVRHAGDGIVLADHVLLQVPLHLQQASRLRFLHARHRDTGPTRDDCCDIVGVHDLIEPLLFLPGGTPCLKLGRQLDALALQVGGQGIVALLPGCLLLDRQAVHLLAELLQFRWQAVDGNHQFGASLVDQVDGLVGQMPLLHVTIRENRRCAQGIIGDAHAVMRLIAILETFEHLDGVLDRGLLDEDRRKAPLERRVLLDVLAVLVQRSGANALQFPARQGGLHHVRGVNCPLSGTGAHHCVQFVDEQDDLSLRLLDLLQGSLQTLLELAAEA